MGKGSGSGGGRRPAPPRGFPGRPGKGSGGQPRTNQWSPGPMPGSSYNQPQLPGGYGRMRYEPQQFSSYGVPTSIAQPGVFGWGESVSGLETPGSRRQYGGQTWTQGTGGRQWTDRYGRGWGTDPMQRQQQQFGGGPGKGGRGQPSPQQFPGGPGKGGGGYGQAQQLGQQLQPAQLQPAGAASPYFQDIMGRAAYEPQGQAQQLGRLQQQLAGQQQALGAGLGGVGMYGGMQDGAAAEPARSYETYPDAAQQEQKTAWEQQQQQAAAPVPQRWTPEEKASWAQQQLQQQLQQAQQQLQPPSDMMMTRSDTGESMTAEEYAARQAGYQPQTSPVPFQRSEVSRTPAPLERQQQRRLDQLRGRLSKLEGEVGIPPMLPQKPDMSIPPMLPQKPVFEGPLPGPRLPAPPKAIPDISLPGWMAPQTPEVGIPPMLPQKPVFEGPLPGPRLPPTPPRGIRAIPRLGASRGVFAKNPSKRRGGR